MKKTRRIIKVKCRIANSTQPITTVAEPEYDDLYKIQVNVWKEDPEDNFLPKAYIHNEVWATVKDDGKSENDHIIALQEKISDVKRSIHQKYPNAKEYDAYYEEGSTWYSITIKTKDDKEYPDWILLSAINSYGCEYALHIENDFVCNVNIKMFPSKGKGSRTGILLGTINVSQLADRNSIKAFQDRASDEINKYPSADGYYLTADDGNNLALSRPL